MTNVLTEPPRPAPAALATEQEAREVAESAREKDWIKPSFVRQLFEGRIALDLIHPFPTQSAEDLARAKPFMRTTSRSRQVPSSTQSVPVSCGFSLPPRHARSTVSFARTARSAPAITSAY